MKFDEHFNTMLRGYNMYFHRPSLLVASPPTPTHKHTSHPLTRNEPEPHITSRSYGYDRSSADGLKKRAKHAGKKQMSRKRKLLRAKRGNVVGPAALSQRTACPHQITASIPPP